MTESEHGDLRAARRQQTHDEIARAARELALERGASAVTVDEIATASGVSRRTFFNYFPTKEDALLQGPPDPTDAEVERFVSDTESSWADALRRLLVDHAALLEGQRTQIHETHRLLTANPELLAAVHKRFSDSEARLSEVIARRNEATGDPVDAPVIAALATSLLRVAGDRWFAEPEPASGRLAELFTEALDGLRAALS